MQNLYIEASDYVPHIDFQVDTGELNISGESYHEYTLEFFEPIFDWIKEFTSEPNKSITLNFKMSYFNTSSSRRFLEIMNLLQTYHFNNNVNYKYYFN
jgi:hypothetical protein